jgi:ABC-2 type transport system permease protein
VAERRGPGLGLGLVASLDDLPVYRRLLGARIRADWQYRTSFVLYLLGQTIVAGTELVAIVVIFTAVDRLAGWSAAEVALLFGLSGVAFGLADLFVSPVEMAARHIKAGSFDQFLVRPAGALWQLLATEFALRRLGRSVQPLVVLAVALRLVDVAWGPAEVVLVPLTVACGAVIYGAIWVITSSLAFWTVETQEVGSSFTYGGDALTSYPFDVLGTWLRRLVTFVVPLGSIAYLPALRLLGKRPPFGLPLVATWSGPVVALVAALVARAVWRLAIRHYRTTGS